MNADDKIRAALRMRADEVDPSAAGWDAITTGIAARRARTRWLRGTALAGAALTVAAVAVLAVRDPGRDTLHQVPLTSGTPTAPASASPSTSPSSAATADPDAPLTAIWPLTTEGELHTWQADHATYPSLATPGGSALAFARRYLGVADATVAAAGRSGDVLRYTVSRNGLVVTTLDLRGFGADNSAPYVVTLAHDDTLTIETPLPGFSSDTPLVAHGTYGAPDPSITVTLRADSGASAPVQLATGHAVTGPPNVWDARLAFRTAARTGSLLVTNASLRDGGIATAAAVPMWFGAFPAGPDVPKTFVAARDGRIALLSSAGGTVVRWLTEALPGGGAYDPQLSPDGRFVVYAQGAGTCSAEIRRVPVAGGAPVTLVGGGEGALANPSLFVTTLAYERTGCGAGAKHEVVVKAGGGVVTEPVDGEVLGGITVGERFAVYVTSKAGVTRLHEPDTTGELADSPAAPPAGCQWLAATWGARDGNDRQTIVAAARCGDTRLYRLDADGKNPVKIGTAAALLVTSLDYSARLDTLVLGDGGGGMRRAFTWRDGAVYEVPGSAQRPSWH